MEISPLPSTCAETPSPLSDFDFALPAELIAQEPAERRDGARLMLLDRSRSALQHGGIRDLPGWLRPGDLLIANNTKVLPARVFGRGPGGGAVELLLVRPYASTAPAQDNTTNPDSAARSPHPDPLPQEMRVRGRSGIPALDSGFRDRRKSKTEVRLPGESRGPAPVEDRKAYVPPLVPGFRREDARTDNIVSEKIDSLLRRNDDPFVAGNLNDGVGADEAVWLCIGKPAKRLRRGVALRFGELAAQIIEVLGDGTYVVAFATGDVRGFLAAHGEMPLPPYIQRPDGPLPLDRERYQTIFAASPGAVAAPTAGLHFTDELLADLARAGIGLAQITLHVGPGTFRPIRTLDPSQHVMDPEWYEIPAATVAAIHRTRDAGGRVIAVGTTTTRALESSVDASGEIRNGEGWATCYIRPGHRFRAIDALFTNFHLPGSTLLLLVSALAGRERILNAYAEAVRQRYRFYSYGDAMLIL